jgi:peptide/nickel transport system substrate-binding protein
MLIPIAFVNAAGIPNPDHIYMLNGAGSFETIDPAWAYDTASGELIQNIYDALLAYDGKGTEKFVPMLADWWPGLGGNPANAIVPITPAWNRSSAFAVGEAGETWLFRIRKGVKWQDPKYGEVTCEDVVYTFKRVVLFDHTNGPAWMFFEPLLNITSGYIGSDERYDTNVNGAIDAAEYPRLAAEVDNFVQTNGTHVWFNLPAGYAAFQQILVQTWSSIMCKQWCIDQGLWKGNINDYADFVATHDPTEPGPLMDPDPKSMGCGAYKVAAILADPSTGWFTYERFDNYWRGAAPTKFATIKLVTEWANRKAQFFSTDSSLQADLCAVPRSNCPELHLNGDMNGPAVSGFRVTFPEAPAQTMDMLAFGFNVTGSTYMPKLGPVDFPTLFMDRHMRLAAMYLFNASLYIKDVFLGEALQSNTFMPPATLYYNKSKMYYGINIAEAQKHLDLAWGGQVKEKGLVLRLAYNTGNTARQTFCSIIADGLKYKLNWGPNAVKDIEPIGVPWATYMSELRGKKLCVFNIGWMADFPDPHNWAVPFMSSGGTYMSRQRGVYGLNPESMNWAPENRTYGPPPYTNAIGETVTAINNTYMDHLIASGIKYANTDPRRNLLYLEMMDIYFADAIQLPTVAAIRRHYERTWLQGWMGTWNENPICPGQYFYTMYKQAAGTVFSVDLSATETIANVTTAYPYVQVVEAAMKIYDPATKKNKNATIDYNVHVVYKTGTVDIWFLCALKRTAPDGRYYFPITQYASLGPGEAYTTTLSWFENGIDPTTVGGTGVMSPGNWTISLYVSPIGTPGGEVEDTNLANNIANDPNMVKARIWPEDLDYSGAVGILDISVAGKAYGSVPGEKRWDARADINGDKKITIVDLAKIAKQFGKTFLQVAPNLK